MDGNVLVGLLLAIALLGGADAGPHDYFAIQVVDQATGRGVPLVELRTVNNIRCFTDSAGYVAFHEPGLMNQRVFFLVDSPGYEYPADGFGYRGRALDVTAGGQARIELRRINIAERLYRQTGGGIYRDSVLLGRAPPLRDPVLNGLVFGSDSVVNTVYRGRIHWFWGDTARPAYPLGNFNVPGAVSLLPADGGLDPAQGVDLTYYVNSDGFARAMAPVPGEGPTWIGGLVSLPDAAGRERLFASYAKIRPASMETYERGLVEFNDEREVFEKVQEFPLQAAAFPDGHPFRHQAGGIEYIYFATGYPLVRVRADVEALRDIGQYEAFTPLLPGCTAQEPQLDRDSAGRLCYAWKRNAPPLIPAKQKELLEAGKLQPRECVLNLRDRDTGKPVQVHGGSVYWNAYRQHWVMIALEIFGTSLLGEIWYAEADAPLGPWVYAVKVVTHQQYSFYNPKQHPFFDQEGGRIIYFEGTYTNLFSGNPDQTPRYDYNQIMYRLDLADPRLAIPAPVYRDSTNGPRLGTLQTCETTSERHPAGFLALDRPVPGAVGIHARADGSGGGLALRAGPPGTTSAPASAAEGWSADPVFYALPADLPDPPPATVALYEYRPAAGGPRIWATEDSHLPDDLQRAAQPLCRVWRGASDIVLPAD